MSRVQDKRSRVSAIWESYLLSTARMDVCTTNADNGTRELATMGVPHEQA